MGPGRYHTDLYFVRWAKMVVCEPLEVQEVWSINLEALLQNEQDQ